MAEAVDRRRWDELVLSSPSASFMQAWEWGEMQRRFGQQIWRLVTDDVGAVALVIKRDLPVGRSWLYVPRGPIGDFEAIQEQLIELGRGENAMFIRIDPTWQAAPDGWRKADHEVQPQHTIILDLKQSEEDLLAAMHSKTRYNIRLAEKKGVTVRFSKDRKDLEYFLKLAQEVSGRAPIAFHPDGYYREMIKVPFVELAIAEHEGDVLAVHIVASFGRVATYVHGASSQTKKQLMAPHLLQWETIKRVKKEGFEEYDFFGVAPEDAGENHPWAGITRFKEGFGGKRESYMGAYDYVLESGLYHAFHVARRVRGFINN